MNKLLILCDMFPPAFAPRMGYLCKYLKRMGWEITVVTEYIEDDTFRFLAENAKVTYIDFYPRRNGSRILRRAEWLWVMLLDLLFHYKDWRTARVCRPLLQANKYKCILCSTYRTYPLTAARKLSKRFNLPFVADLRDIIEQYPSNEYISHRFNIRPRWLNTLITKLFRHRLLRDRNKALREARYITTVSPWHVQTLRPYNPNVRLIYNGYDPDMFYPQAIKNEQFWITYTGRLLSIAIRNPDLLFEAIRRLANDRVIDPALFRVVWYMDEKSHALIRQEARRHKVEEFMDYHDYVPASEIPFILNKSSVLLSLANKSGSSGPKGIMTTKFFEFLAVEKPILCVRSDEACLAEAIRETNSGLAATQMGEVYDFLKRQYETWEEQGYTSISVNKEKRIKYSREEQAKQFAQLFEEL